MTKQILGGYLISVGLLVSITFAQDNSLIITSDYIIGPGDELELSVWKEDALTKMLTVLPDGKLTFPLIGSITAAGRSANQIKTEITKRLASYVSDPIVSAGIHQVNSLLILYCGKSEQTRLLYSQFPDQGTSGLGPSRRPQPICQEPPSANLSR